MRTQKKLNPWLVFTHVCLIVGSIIMLLPFVWMLLTSFKTLAEIYHVPMVWFPAKFDFSNYLSVLNKMNFFRYYLNSIIVTLTVTVGQLFLASIAAYAFARLEFPGREAIFVFLLSVLMVPSQMSLIPKYVMMNSFGWVDTFWALIIPNLPSIYGTFLLRQFFKTLPKELEDAAKIDGCSYFRTYWNVILPLSTNALISLAIFVLLWSWNDLLWPLIVTTSDEMRLLTVGLATLNGGIHKNDYHLMMAAGVMATVPMILVFVFGQKQFISGITLSGIKG